MATNPNRRKCLIDLSEKGYLLETINKDNKFMGLVEQSDGSLAVIDLERIRVIDEELERRQEEELARLKIRTCPKHSWVAKRYTHGGGGTKLTCSKCGADSSDWYIRVREEEDEMERLYKISRGG